MSDAVNALGSAEYSGASAMVEELPLQGMITLRGDLSDATFGTALKNASGCRVPDRRAILRAEDRMVAWMSPDELLILTPYQDSADLVVKLERAMSGLHHLAVDVSDARAMFRVTGDGAREVLSRLCPVDMAPAALSPGEIRRTRMAQVPAAFWIGEDGAISIICFRSVARYVFDLLAAAAGGEPVGFIC